MSALLLLSAGLAAALDSCVRRRGPASGAPTALLWGGGAAVTALVALLGLAVLDLGVPGLLPALLSPALWLAWPRVLPGGRGLLARAAVLAAALALSLTPLVLLAPAPTTWERVLAVVGAGLLMGGPANDVVAALLSLVREGGAAAGAPGPGEDGGALLRGGRWIGALERLLVLVLAFSDAPAAVAAVVAAKGVIRFPEISRDAGTGAHGGAKAEEFLVGSFTSWLLAAGAYLLLRALGIG